MSTLDTTTTMTPETPETAGTATGPTFTDTLWRTHRDLFEAFWAHPFLAGLRDGTLSREATLHYVGQDHQYLTAYLRCYGLGMAASPDRVWMRHHVDSSLFILQDEGHPHHVMCDAFGVDYEAAQHERLAPNAQAYVDHMMEAGHDSLGVLMASLLPCPWTYIWAGERWLRECPPESAASNPFHGWWEFYGSAECLELLAGLRLRVDALAEQAGPAERARMARAFELSCHHEIRFWEMAFTQQTWDDLPRRILAGR